MRQALAAREQAHSAEQRKLATVMFADIVDFAVLAERRDPEDVRELQRAFFTTIAAPILEYGGVIEKYIGDAVMAVFGVPEVHEDDAERAVRAALAMQAGLAALNVALRRTHTVELEMRVGIHTGKVVATNITDEFDQTPLVCRVNVFVARLDGERAGFPFGRNHFQPTHNRIRFRRRQHTDTDESPRPRHAAFNVFTPKALIKINAVIELP